MIDAKRGALVDAIGSKTSQLTLDIDRVTSDALKSIETRGQAFSQTMMGNGSEVARTINSASEMATGAVGKSLKDLEQASRSAIDQSRQVSIAAVTEMQETSKILRTDTVALFERLREGNILLQEVLTGAHDNLNSLERALVTRVADFVSAMNDVTSRNGAATQNAGRPAQRLQHEDHAGAAGPRRAVDPVRRARQGTGRSRAGGRGEQQEHHRFARRTQAGAGIARHRPSTCARPISTSGCRASPACSMNRWPPPKSVPATSPASSRRPPAPVRPRSPASSRRCARPPRKEHRQTIDAMHDIYRQTTDEADTMFKQSTEKFANLVSSMKQMAFEMHNELEATRNELRRGVLEMPQEAAESTAQMRKVIVDQIEALAELNRIVAQHGRGLDVSTTGRASAQRQEEPMMAAASAARDTETRVPRHRQRLDAAAAGPRHARLLAPHRSAAGRARRRQRPGPRRLAVGPAEPHGRQPGRPTGREAPRGRAAPAPQPQAPQGRAIRWSRCRSTSAG